MVRYAFLLVCLLFVPLVYAATFECEIIQNSSCLANQTLLVRLNSSETGAAPNNSHAQLANFSGGLYNWSVCCWTDAFRTLESSCEGNGYAVLRLANTSNSHVQTNANSDYAYDACYNVTSGTVECEYPVSSCSAGYSGVAGIASSEQDNTTNAHVAAFGYYEQRVCCRVGGQNAPVVDHANLTPISATTRDDLRCENGSVTDADGDSVTLHYTWLRNGTSIAALNLPMDYDSASGLTHDISGGGNHGAVSGATFLPTGGQVGGAFSFDGSDDRIVAGNGSVISTEPFMVALWVKAGSQTAYALDKKNGTAAAAGYHVSLSGSAVRFTVSDGSSSANVTAGTTVSSSVWHHYAFVRNASGVHAYADGSYENSSLSGGSLDVNGPINVTLGANASLADGFFSGQLDEVTVLGVQLTASGIRTLYATDGKFFNGTDAGRGNSWNCSITPVDSTGLNGSTVYSNQSTISGSPPLNVSPVYPENDDTGVFERTVNLTWTQADERDGDQVNYTVNLTVTPGVCSVETVQTNIQDTNFTLGPLCFDQPYFWNVTACDIDGCSSVSTTFNFTIASVISITLLANNTDFGTLTVGQSETTDDYAPVPFLVENDGNVLANVTLVGNSSLYASVGLDDTAWQFRVEDNETGSMNTSGSQTSYTPVPSSFTHAIKQLNYTNASDTVATHINVTVPADEPGGEKQANVTFQAVIAE